MSGLPICQGCGWRMRPGRAKASKYPGTRPRSSLVQCTDCRQVERRALRIGSPPAPARNFDPAMCREWMDWFVEGRRRRGVPAQGFLMADEAPTNKNSWEPMEQTAIT